jgi:hypothetical protein
MKRLLIAATLFMLAPSAVSAQIPGINLNLGARAGMFTPMSTLAETPFGDLKLKPGLGIGASLELDLPLSPVNVRANLDAALGAKVELDGQESQGDEVDVVAITGDLVFRPLPRIVVFQPYLLAGAGIKRYSFDGTLDNATNSESDFTGHVGIGGDLKIGPLAVLAELSDYISSFKNEGTGDSKLQNDVFVMVGFRIGML